MPTHIREWFVYRYRYNNMKTSMVSVRAIGPDRTKTLDTLPPTVIRMFTVQAKNKADAYQKGIELGV